VCVFTLAMMLEIGEEAFEELAAIGDAEALCRRLLACPWGWGSSTRHAEVVELLGKVQDTSELPISFVALMLSTCQRWDRVTGRLIAAIQDSGLLDSAALDELAQSFLSDEHVIAYRWRGSRRNGSRSTLMTGMDGPARSTRTRSLTTACPSSRRCAGGRHSARCARPRHGSRSCCAPPRFSSHATAPRSSTGCLTPLTCSPSRAAAT